MTMMHHPGPDESQAIRCDVAIVGGGTAGSVAAIAAAHMGASVVIVEKENFLGGNVAAQPLEAMFTFHDTEGRIVSGIPEAVVRQLMALKASPGHVDDDVGYCRSMTPYNNEVLKSVVAMAVERYAVTTIFNAEIFDIRVVAARVVQLMVASGNDQIQIRPEVLIDSSGDGICLDRCGINYSVGNENGIRQPASLLYKVAHVDTEVLIRFVLDSPTDFKTYLDRQVFLDGLKRSKRFVHLWGLGDLLSNAYATGEISYEKRELQLLVDRAENSVIINGTRVGNIDGTREDELARAYFALRKQVLESLQLLRRRVPGFADCYLATVGSRVGVREGKHMYGGYRITGDDILQGREFEDAVAYCAFPIDIHNPEGSDIKSSLYGKRFGIPFRALTAPEVTNFLVAGRTISADHIATGALRSSVTCMATGQVAGVAAAMMARSRTESSELLAARIVKAVSQLPESLK